MPHYFTREEAESLLPQISLILRKIQQEREAVQQAQDALDDLREQAAGNGHHLLERMTKLQREVAHRGQLLRAQVEELVSYGCELKDPDTGLIDFLSLRDGREVYLCWRLGEERIDYWHHLHTGFPGRQRL